MPSQRNRMRRIEARIEELEALVEAVEPEQHTCGECTFFLFAQGCVFAWPEGGRTVVYAGDEACGWFKEPGHIDERDEAAEPEDTDATIRKLREEHDMFEQMWKDTAAILGNQIKAHDKTIDEARAEIERLSFKWTQAVQDCDYLRRLKTEAIEARVAASKELAETKAEVGSLHLQLKREYGKHRAAEEHLRDRCAEAQLEKNNGEAALRGLRIDLAQAKAEIERLHGRGRQVYQGRRQDRRAGAGDAARHTIT